MLCVGVSEGWYNDNSVLVGASEVKRTGIHSPKNPSIGFAGITLGSGYAWTTYLTGN
jgi:hypothetical protein